MHACGDDSVAAIVVYLGCCNRISNCTTRHSRDGGLDARYLHESSKDAFREAPPVDMWWVFHVPYTPISGTVPITDVVDHVTENRFPGCTAQKTTSPTSSTE